MADGFPEIVVDRAVRAPRQRQAVFCVVDGAAVRACVIADPDHPPFMRRGERARPVVSLPELHALLAAFDCSRTEYRITARGADNAVTLREIWLDRAARLLLAEAA